MGVYDIFLKNSHPKVISEWMVKNNQILLEYLSGYFPKNKKHIRLLEVGPGKGYLKDAVFRNNQKRGGGQKIIDYYAADRNEAMLENLHLDREHVMLSGLLDLQSERKFDIIFVGYVIEHLPDGIALYHALENLKQMLKENGILVLLFPDCMKLGMEFYNIDYTHTLPTTKRNVSQAVLDCGMRVRKAVDIRGILFPRKVESRLQYLLRSACMKFYSYKLCGVLTGFLYKVPVWDLRNVFWKAFGLLKEPNVLFIVSRS